MGVQPRANTIPHRVLVTSRGIRFVLRLTIGSPEGVLSADVNTKRTEGILLLLVGVWEACAHVGRLYIGIPRLICHRLPFVSPLRSSSEWQSWRFRSELRSGNECHYRIVVSKESPPLITYW